MKAKEVDEMIRAALSKEEAEYYEKLNDDSLFDMVTSLYKGKMMWFNVINTAVSLMFTALGVYCLVQFLNVQNTNDVIRWGAGLAGCSATISMIKVWTWNQMDKNAVVKEIKKLQIILTNTRVDKD